MFFQDKNFDKTLPNSAPINVKWKRAKFLYPNCVYAFDFCNCDLTQSQLGDCFLIAVLDSVLSRLNRNPCLLSLFLKIIGAWQNFNPSVYTGKFIFSFHNTQIIIDDYLPVNSYTNEPLYCRNLKNPQEMWPALFEKACAKMVGSYNVLNKGGDPRKIFKDIFGFETILLQTADCRDQLYTLINNNRLAVCYQYDETQQLENISASGIVNKHAYAIIETNPANITLKNPWNNHVEYIYQLSSSKQCKDHTVDISADGIFSMTWSQFCFEFPNVIITSNDLDKNNETFFWVSEININKWKPRLILLFAKAQKTVELMFHGNGNTLVFKRDFEIARMWIAFDLCDIFIDRIKCIKPHLCHVVYYS